MQIGAVSASICAFCRRSLGGFSVVSIQPCLLFSDSGSKLGQKLSMSGLRSWVSISKACYIRATPISYFGMIYIFRNRVYGAAHPHHRAGPACHLPAAGDHRHGHMDVGAFRPLVAVVGHVLCRPGLDAPMLILPGVDGRQGVLLRPMPCSFSVDSAQERAAMVRAASMSRCRCRCPDHDIHIIPCSSRTISTRPRILWARKLEIGLSISSREGSGRSP